MTYNPGQFRNVVPFVTAPPQALILAGPADGDEAQVAKELWPNLTVVGLEPNPEAVSWQFAHGWPGEKLIGMALSDRRGVGKFHFHHDQKSRLRSSRLEQDFGAGSIEVNVTTLDDIVPICLSGETDLMVWLDIEGHELQALRGGRNLFTSGRVRYVNVECLDRLWITNEKIDRFLTGYGLKCVHEWNVQKGFVRDKFYRRD